MFVVIIMVIFIVIYQKFTNTQKWYKNCYQCTD